MRRVRLWSPILIIVLLASGGCVEAPETGTSTEEAAAASAPGTDIVIAPLDVVGDSLRLGVPIPITTRAGYDNQPAFGLEESGIVWTSIRNGQAEVYRQGEEGTAPTQLTDTPESEYSPTLRPRGMTVVRVEADGRQRLWRYETDGTPAAPVLPESDSVGYHAWLDSTHVALFVLGTPPTLQVVNVETGTDTVVARRIGRSLQSVPGRDAISFVKVGPDSSTSIHQLDGTSLTTRRLAATPTDDSGGDHTWTPEGRLLMATDDSLVVWDRQHARWDPQAALDTMHVSRLAVSPSGDRLAMVVEE